MPGPSSAAPPCPPAFPPNTGRGYPAGPIAALQLPDFKPPKGSKQLLAGSRLTARLERPRGESPCILLHNSAGPQARYPVNPEEIGGLMDGAQLQLVLQRAAPGEPPRFDVLAETDAYVSSMVGTVVRGGDAFYVQARSPHAPVRRARLDTAAAGDLAGHCVLVDLADPASRMPRATLVERLSEATSLRSRIFAIAAEQGARFGFSEQVHREIAGLRALPPERGVDFTHLDFVTIDNFSTQVMDQAMHLQRDGDGYILHYAIADAARLVPRGGAIDAEACLRGASHYLPCDPPKTLGESISVTPAEVAVGMGSLLPDAERPAFVATVHLDALGEVTSHVFARGTIRSRAKLAFSQVQELHDGTGCRDLGRAAYGESLWLLREVGQKLQTAATRRGILDLGGEPPRLVVATGTDDEVLIETRQESSVEVYNSHVSVLVNALVGDDLANNGLPGLWRTQEPMDEESEQRLRQRLRDLGLPWRSGQPLQTYLAHLDPQDPRTRVARYLTLRHTRSAAFSTQPTGHFALALDAYSQFTAPMRRYPDVVVHHVLRAQCEGSPIPYRDAEGQAWLQRTADSAARHRSRDGRIMRHVDTLLLAAVLQGAGGGPVQRLTGTVLGTFRDRTIVQLHQPPVHLETPRAKGVSPGQEVSLQVTRVDLDAPRVEAFIEHGGQRLPIEDRRQRRARRRQESRAAA